ncbi:hypothetical protein [Marinibactrum halimedae]|uniref:Uncharacterized protein n=1 Tax=Marinibactrum halimedae TaxID=1444977 RepID=A0AA37WLU4_9GAMM|nr:hypothetical protein [Marinibactrum halimedae]MCD9460141.1 hypothetical protein [Marinibactrum halimedae]GLS26389.1 hypothetical protein GCM10007877_21040 [Marinibactrum halimedae]
MLFGTTKNPKGPDLNKAVPVRCNLSGTRLLFLKPLRNTPKPQIKGKDIEADLPLSFDINIYSSDNFMRVEERSWGLCFVEEEYKYKGIPLYNPDVGGMVFSASLRKACDYSNLLLASHYEAWLQDDMNAYFSPGEGSPFDEWMDQYPLFWQVFSLPKTQCLQWIAYAVQKLNCERGDQTTYFVRSAITSEHELVFSFKTLTDDYDSGAFELFKKIVRFILINIEINLAPSLMSEIRELEEKGERNFSERKNIIRFDDAPRHEFSNYDLLDDPNLYFAKLGKTVDRRLWVEES